VLDEQDYTCSWLSPSCPCRPSRLRADCRIHVAARQATKGFAKAKVRGQRLPSMWKGQKAIATQGRVRPYVGAMPGGSSQSRSAGQSTPEPADCDCYTESGQSGQAPRLCGSIQRHQVGSAPTRVAGGDHDQWTHLSSGQVQVATGRCAGIRCRGQKAFRRLCPPEFQGAEIGFDAACDEGTDRAGSAASSVIKAAHASRERQRATRGRVATSGSARDLRGSVAPSTRRRAAGRLCMAPRRAPHAVVEVPRPRAPSPPGAHPGYARERGPFGAAADPGSIPGGSTNQGDS